MLREAVITFEVLSFCRNQDRVCVRRKRCRSGLWGNNVWLEVIEAEKEEEG